MTYATDKVGRTTRLNPAAGFGSLSSLAISIIYRAFGGVKSMSYATTAETNISLNYDTRLRPVNIRSRVEREHHRHSEQDL